MRAAVYHGPRDVRVDTVPDAGPPGKGELMLKVLRASVCGTDAAEFEHGPVLVPLHAAHPASGHAGPLVLGHEFAGVVEAVGPGVADFAVGDRVASGAGVSCGRCPQCAEGRTNLCRSYYTLGLHADGGLAERVTVPARTCARVPEGCSSDGAALAQPLAVALHALDRGALGPDDTLALFGAGGIGAFAIAGAAARGTGTIVAVDVRDEPLRRAGRLGAHHIVDARTEDAAAVIHELTGGAGADVTLEASGAADAPGTALRATRAGGRVVLVGLQAQPVPLDLLDITLREVDVRPTVAHVCASNLPEALEILADGRLEAEVVDRVIGLGELVERGLEPLVRREVSGKVLVDPER